MKKVILYNTTIGALLKNSEQALKKMQWVFSYFARQKDLVILWRPHPLLKATLTSMQPELLEEYLRLERFFRENKVGIYDDSSDPERGIAAADAYYGDLSSVITLFQATGKPVFIQNCKVLEAAALPVRWACAENTFCYDRTSGDYYFISWVENRLFTGNAGQEIMHQAAKPADSRRVCFYYAVKSGKEIIFSPRKAGTFCFYDTEKNTVRLERLNGLDDSCYLADYGGTVYAVGLSCLDVYIYRRETGRFEIITKTGRQGEKMAVFRNTAVHGKLLVMLEREKNTLHLFDLEARLWSQRKTAIASAQQAVYDGMFFWICNEDGEVYRWDGCEDYILCWKTEGKGRVALLSAADTKIYIYLSEGEHCIGIDRQSLKASKLPLKCLKCGMRHDYCKIGAKTILIRNYEGGKGWLCWDKDHYCILEEDSLQSRQLAWKADEEQTERIRRLFVEEQWERGKDRNCFAETERLTLPFLLTLLKRDGPGAAWQPEKTDSGERIHRTVLALLEKRTSAGEMET